MIYVRRLQDIIKSSTQPREPQSGNTVHDDLVVLARLYDPVYEARLIEPRFSATASARDWVCYVPAPVQKLWPVLSQEAKLVAFVCAEFAARLED